MYTHDFLSTLIWVVPLQPKKHVCLKGTPKPPSIPKGKLETPPSCMGCLPTALAHRCPPQAAQAQALHDDQIIV